MSDEEEKCGREALMKNTEKLVKFSDFQQGLSGLRRKKI